MKSNTNKSALKFMITVAGAVLTTGLATAGSANPAAAALYFLPNGQVTGLPVDTITFDYVLGMIWSSDERMLEVKNISKHPLTLLTAFLSMSCDKS